jgi:Ca-activated chloride channel family protein
MNFLTPYRLLLLLAVAALVGIYLLVQLRRKSYAVKFTNIDLLDRVAPRKPGWRRHVPAAMFLLALATLTVGFAQPTRETQVPRERATIVLAIDTSLSMKADDVAPSRIDAAKSAASSFLDVLPPKINVGLVLFNGNAAVRVAPTTDREAIRRGLAGAELGERTAIGEAIFTSLEAIESVPADDDNTAPPARIVLMSDGSNTYGRPNEVATQAAIDAGVPVSTIGFGTDDGTIPDPASPWITVPVPVDRESLETIATETDGTYFSAFTEGQLRDVYQDIGSSIGYTTEEVDASSWFIGGALLLLLATSAFSMAWFSRLP